MKKFSTIALLLAAGLPLIAQSAHAAPAQATTAQAQAIAARSQCEFLPDAPDKHEVVRGDTLWGISEKFLQNPWCWPKVWGMNQEDIRNPHWIYPGQIVYFDRVNGRLRLGNPLGSGANGGSGKLMPQIRTEGLGSNAIPAIPAHLIEPFLSQPLVIDKDDMKDAPRIVAAPEGRVMMSKNDKIYVRGDLKGGTSFQIFRPGTALKDPDTKAIVGYEAVFLGTVKLDRRAETEDGVDSFIVVKSREEMGVGDRLVPVPPTPILNYVPHPAEKNLQARVLSIYGGVDQAGQNQIVAINRGSKDGLNMSSVLELSRYGKIIPDPTDHKKPVRLPQERYGSLFIFRIFNNISYGLVMQVTDAVKVGDVAHSPETVE
ncbi:MAG: LysM peptidoglycan-binding domain-containing protein [Burkholderiales bacterium]|nr:LysM peptidoglycan-binding domain-containing protein [Burkholderiales bacterium]